MVVHEADRIKDNMIMNMVFINVGCKNIFILSTEHFIGELLADFVGDFGRTCRARIFVFGIPCCIAVFLVQSNSFAAVSTEQPNEETSSFSSVFAGLVM